jgi:hypothetical protein
MVWTSSFIGGAGLLAGVGEPSVDEIVGLWCLGAVVAALTGYGLLKTTPSMRHEFSPEYRRMGKSLAIETLAATGSAQLSIVLIGAIGSLELVGALRAVFGNVFGLIYVISQGIMPQLLVDFRRASEQDGNLPKKAMRWSIALIAATLGFGLAARFMANSFGEFLAGDTYTQAKPLIVPISVTVAFSLSISVMITALCFTDTPERVRAIRLWIAGITSILPAAGLAVLGTGGAIACYALSAVVPSVLLYAYLRTRKAVASQSMEPGALVAATPIRDSRSRLSFDENRQSGVCAVLPLRSGLLEERSSAR